MEACRSEFLSNPADYANVETTFQAGGFTITLVTKPSKLVCGNEAAFFLVFTPTGEANPPIKPEKIAGTAVARGADGFVQDRLLLTFAAESDLVYGVREKLSRGKTLEIALEIGFADGTKSDHKMRLHILDDPKNDTGDEYNQAKWGMVVQHELMYKTGKYWYGIWDELEKETPDFGKASRDLVRIQKYQTLFFANATPHKHADKNDEFLELSKEFRSALEEFRKTLAAGNPQESSDKFLSIDAMHCTKCHLKFRWAVMEDLSRFPNLHGAAAK